MYWNTILNALLVKLQYLRVAWALRVTRGWRMVYEATHQIDRSSNVAGRRPSSRPTSQSYGSTCWTTSSTRLMKAMIHARRSKTIDGGAISLATAAHPCNSSYRSTSCVLGSLRFSLCGCGLMRSLSCNHATDGSLGALITATLSRYF